MSSTPGWISQMVAAGQTQHAGPLQRLPSCLPIVKFFVLEARCTVPSRPARGIAQSCDFEPVWKLQLLVVVRSSSMQRLSMCKHTHSTGGASNVCMFTSKSSELAQLLSACCVAAGVQQVKECVSWTLEGISTHGLGHNGLVVHHLHGEAPGAGARPPAHA